MRGLVKKLVSPRGETVAEVLCAVLVAGLAVAMMAGAATAASHLNATARKEDSAYYEELALAETREAGTGKPGELTISVGGKPYTVDIALYGGEGEKALRSYGGAP